MSRSTLTSLGILGLFTGSILIWLLFLLFNTQSATFRFDTSMGAEVTLVHSSDKREDIENDKEYKLQKGDYEIEIAGNNILPETIEFKVESSRIDRQIELSYTDTYLKTLLEKERSSIQAKLTSTYPRFSSLYMIKNGDGLMLDGSWYIARLRYIAPTTADEVVPFRDTLKLVMHKDASGWKVVTKPPAIVISKPEYPDIPETVLNTINAQEIVSSPTR